MRPKEADLVLGNNIGEMAEWSNAAVLKTVDLNGSGGSNPSLSAEQKEMASSLLERHFSFSCTPLRREMTDHR